MRKFVPIAVILALLTGANSTAVFSASDRELPKAGSVWILRGELVIPPDSAHVTIQNSRATAWTAINRHKAYCQLEVMARLDAPQTVQPDRFLITRSYQNYRTVETKPGFIRVRKVNDGDSGPAFAIFETVFVLKSARQPQVRWLTCARWDDVALGRDLTLSEIRSTVGSIFELDESGATN